jgi:hypothetical protein
VDPRLEGVGRGRLRLKQERRADRLCLERHLVAVNRVARDGGDGRCHVEVVELALNVGLAEAERLREAVFDRGIVVGLMIVSAHCN